ncbi:TetR/AcrR family transcriptional regulator [Streptomyces sp. WMMC500]|uniref:TetR/AcrR family transcriptional regulator n=1 Tax=Streptomyces sp. WMMC500 TaxID=3015154 RepID=UPI00248C7415|nr:TetR/AcrR family transcriptional regulator [Streptomyces sp. WMMC500]WBB59370.1 TetR/AcrR family transcriptional regulator [Streptomyces sp. WMMC500]
MSDRTDPRIMRTVGALQRAAVELASERPVSRITVAELTKRAGVTRATFYNRYSTVLDPLIEVLYADLETGHRLEDRHRAEGWADQDLLRLAVGEVADHVERYADLYRQSLGDPADRGIYTALVDHFDNYALAYLARCTRQAIPGTPETGHQVVAQFLAHGFAGAVKAWLGDPDVTREDLVEAAVACAPAWWAPAGGGPDAAPHLAGHCFTAEKP